MNRKRITVIILGLIFLASLLTCGYYIMKAMRYTRLRRTAMAAYEKKDYATAERLLLQYVQKKPDSEEEYVALANIYHEFGNTGMEAQMWQKASSLDMLNQDYRKKMLTSAQESASYALLHGILGRMAMVDERFTDQELYLFVISSYRSGYPKDGADIYQKQVEKDPEIFHKSELGQMAEFIATYNTLSDGDRDAFLYRTLHSEDPKIRFEAIYLAIRRLGQREGDDTEKEEEMERLLKQAVEVNYFAGTPLLADFYFSKFRFGDVIEILEPYLKTIDDIDLYLLYAESCVFTGRQDKLKALEEKLRGKLGSLLFIADYCEILVAYLENDMNKLAAAVRKSGKFIDSPLSRFVRLRVAMANGSFSEIRTVAQEIFYDARLFHDLNNRALFICMDYLSEEMKKQENRKDPSQMADLARTLASYLHGNRLLTEIILMDQYKKGLVKEDDLMNALNQFPDDALLLRAASEFLVFNEKAEQALPIIDQILNDEKTARQQPDLGIQFLHMLALDQTGQQDEAATVFRQLVEQSGFDLDLLYRYFQYCIKNEREEDLMSMAAELDAGSDKKRKEYATFFRIAALFPPENESEKDALDLLASTPTDNPEFAFYAANFLCEHDRLDEAEAKYQAILKTYPIPSLVYANLSIVYHAKGETKKALEAAKMAFELEKESMLPAFIYAKRLVEEERYEEAVTVLKFPRHAVNFREDIIDLWCECMHHVIEKSIADRKFLQAEEQCKHLLLIAPDDEFGKDNLEKVREILFPKKDEEQPQDAEAASLPPNQSGKTSSRK